MHCLTGTSTLPPGVDGVPAVRANRHFFSSVPGSFTMDKEGVVTFLAADGAAVKRYRITAPADTSVATLLEQGQTIASVMAKTEAVAAKAADDTRAAAAKAKEDEAALYARQKAEQAERVAASIKAREEALEARKQARLLQLENAKRKRQGLPPLTELPK